MILTIDHIRKASRGRPNEANAKSFLLALNAQPGEPSGQDAGRHAADRRAFRAWRRGRVLEAQLMADFQPPPPDCLHNLIGMRLVDVIFGAAGGTLRGLVVKNLSWSQRFSSMIVGALTAGSMGPAVSAITQRQLDWWGSICFPSRSAARLGSICDWRLRHDDLRRARSLGQALARRGGKPP